MNLAEQQAQIVRALVAGAPVPTGFSPERVAATQPAPVEPPLVTVSRRQEANHFGLRGNGSTAHGNFAARPTRNHMSGCSKAEGLRQSPIEQSPISLQRGQLVRMGN